MRKRDCLLHLLLTLAALVRDTLTFIGLGLRSRSALMAEDLFLRKQLALHLERRVKPRRANDATRLTMVLLSRLFPWREALVSFKPKTFLRWHRQGFRLYWRWKSRPRGRPQTLLFTLFSVASMAVSNSSDTAVNADVFMDFLGERHSSAPFPVRSPVFPVRSPFIPVR